jgi:hypothetical protein
VTLFGGPDGQAPLTVEAVEREVFRIESSLAEVQEHVSEVAQVATRATVLDRMNVSGLTGGLATTLNIPPGYHAFQLFWRGGQDGSNEFVRLSHRFNSDSGNNYTRAIIRTANDTGSFDNEVTTLGLGTFSSAHGGSVGTGQSGGVTSWSAPVASTFLPVHALCSSSRGVAENVAVVIAASRWTSAATLTQVSAWPAGRNWSSSSWITLVGFRFDG